jgi:hypothetical protein
VPVVARVANPWHLVCKGGITEDALVAVLVVTGVADPWHLIGKGGTAKNAPVGKHVLHGGFCAPSRDDPNRWNHGSDRKGKGREAQNTVMAQLFQGHESVAP